MKQPATLIAALMLLLFCATGQSSADDAGDAKQIIDQAETTLKNFMSDPDMKWFASHLKDAKGVFIVPKLAKGAFIFGVEGGNGVMLARDEKSDAWSEPVFYETSTVSFGLQAGAQSQEAIVDHDAERSGFAVGEQINLGVDGSVAIGPKGDGNRHEPEV